MLSDVNNLQDTDVCYAFVEYEDIASVQSAIKVCKTQPYVWACSILIKSLLNDFYSFEFVA